MNIKDQEATVIYFESPHRLLKTLTQLLELLGDRPAVISRELTKFHEEIKRGTISTLIQYFSKTKVQGEFVILIGKENSFV